MGVCVVMGIHGTPPSFAPLPGHFPACWNPSRRCRDTFQHAGILRAVAGTLSSTLESFALSSGRFPACWNPSRCRRDAFQHAGILRVVAGTLSSMLESFASSPGHFPACWNLSRRRRDTLMNFSFYTYKWVFLQQKSLQMVIYIA